MSKIQMARADLDDSDVQEVLGVLRSERLALGPKAEEFESLMQDYIGVRHAVAVSSGTAALHLLVRALGLSADDEVLVPSFTFVASVNVLLYEGCVPVFVDITDDTFNLDPADLERKITPRTKAILAVDAFGHPAPWDELQQIAERFDLEVIDDCCEALGAEFDGRKLGSFGRGGAFAFYPNKQMTTGEGGMVVTDDDAVASAVRGMRNQGRAAMSAWLEHEQLGYNYRLDEMSAALGCSQLRRIDLLLERRADVARLYSESLASIPELRLPTTRPGVHRSWFVYVVTLPEGHDRDDFMAKLAARDIPSRAYFSPVHRQPFLWPDPGSRHPLPRTEKWSRRTVALPFHPKLTPDEVAQVTEACAEALA